MHIKHIIICKISFKYNNEFGFRFSFHRNKVTTDVTTDVTINVTNYVTINVTIVLNNADKVVLSLLKEKPEKTREECKRKKGFAEIFIYFNLFLPFLL